MVDSTRLGPGHVFKMPTIHSYYSIQVPVYLIGLLSGLGDQQNSGRVFV